MRIFLLWSFYDFRVKSLLFLVFIDLNVIYLNLKNLNSTIDIHIKSFHDVYEVI